MLLYFLKTYFIWYYIMSITTFGFLSENTSRDNDCKKYFDQTINALNNFIPFMKVWYQEWFGSNNTQVSYRSVVGYTTDKHFQNVKFENAVLFVSCEYKRTLEADLYATANLLEIKNDVLAINYHIVNRKGTPWTFGFKVFVRVIIFKPNNFNQKIEIIKDFTKLQTNKVPKNQKNLANTYVM